MNNRAKTEGEIGSGNRQPSRGRFTADSSQLHLNTVPGFPDCRKVAMLRRKRVRYRTRREFHSEDGSGIVEVDNFPVTGDQSTSIGGEEPAPPTNAAWKNKLYSVGPHVVLSANLYVDGAISRG